MKASPRLPFSIMNMPTFPKVPLLFFKMEHVGVFFFIFFSRQKMRFVCGARLWNNKQTNANDC